MVCVGAYSRLTVYREDETRVQMARHLFHILCLAFYTLCMDRRVAINVLLHLGHWGLKVAALKNCAGTWGINQDCLGQTGMASHSAISRAMNRVFLRETL